MRIRRSLSARAQWRGFVGAGSNFFQVVIVCVLLVFVSEMNLRRVLMRKLFGLALLPVLLATTVSVASANSAHSEDEHATPEAHHSATTTQKMTHTETTTHQATGKAVHEAGKVTETTKTISSKTTTMTTLPKTAVVPPQLNGIWVQAQNQLISQQYPQAIDSFQSILSQQPNNVHALQGLATAFQAQGRYSEALQQVNKALALDPVNSRLFLTKGQILDVSGQTLSAVESYLTFTALTPDDGAALQTERRAQELWKGTSAQATEAQQNYLKGLQMLSLHQPEQAISLFDQAQAAEPDSQNTHLMLGKAYLEAGQPDQAIPHFEEAVKLQANNPLAYYHLGSSYELKGQTANAQEAFSKFVQYAPQSEAAVQINRRFDLNQH
jgi:Flp pilus assembly protein TadD